MPDTLHLEVVTPERLLVRQDVTDVQIPGKDGYMGILPGHAALLGVLGIGTLSYMTAGGRKTLSIHGGFLEVLEDHVRQHVADPDTDRNRDRARGTEELLDAVRSYLK